MDRPANGPPRAARTSPTSGLLSFRSGPGRSVLVTVLFFAVTAGLAACGGPGAPEPETVAPRHSFPPVVEAGASPGASAQAARLIGEGREALAADRPADAVTLASRVLSEFPAAPGSSEALWIIARGEAARGFWPAAAEAAARFRELLPPEHPLRPAARTLQGRALAETERRTEAVALLLELPAGATDSLRFEALEVVREAVTEMSFLDLEELVEAPAPAGWEPLRAPVRAEYALGLHVRELEEEAGDWARRALELTSEGPEAELARSILADAVAVERRSAVVLGTLLSRSGSPSERQFSELVSLGIQARLEAASGPGTLPVETLVRDDSGSVEVLPELLREMAESRAFGIVGPLGAAAVAAAAGARPEPIPIISPSAEGLPDTLSAVYSLTSFDPGGPRALARFAVSRDLGTAVIVHSAAAEHTFAADVFVETYEEAGGIVLARHSYPPGSTFFEEPLLAVRDDPPHALLLPIPASDIELLAPQLTYFGLDTLGVRILGTEGWGEPAVIDAVEPRHLNGVVVATPRPPGRQMPGWERFVEDYETTHRQTLRSRVPALGWDATGLLLEAVARGAREPAEVVEALEGIRDFPGATGFLSVEDGRIRRRYHLMRPRDREIIPVETEPFLLEANR